MQIQSTNNYNYQTFRANDNNENQKPKFHYTKRGALVGGITSASTMGVGYVVADNKFDETLSKLKVNTQNINKLLKLNNIRKAFSTPLAIFSFTGGCVLLGTAIGAILDVTRNHKNHDDNVIS